MKTKKRFKIPIFNYGLIVTVFDSNDDIIEVVNNTDGIPFRGITIPSDNYSNVYIKNKDFSTASHEAYHITNLIWKFIGYTPQRDNDEVSAYLSTYIYDLICKVIKFHSNVFS